MGSHFWQGKAMEDAYFFWALATVQESEYRMLFPDSLGQLAHIPGTITFHPIADGTPS
jgi:hypothetical protein